MAAVFNTKIKIPTKKEKTTTTTTKSKKQAVARTSQPKYYRDTHTCSRAQRWQTKGETAVCSLALIVCTTRVGAR